MPDMSRFIANLPADYASLVSMGNALMDQNHFEMAVECYARALEQNPEAVDVRVDYGVCLHSSGKHEQAIANFKQALEQDPAHKIVKFNMGVVYEFMGDTARAIESWEKLLSENPPEELRQRVEISLARLK
jgi:cytochrome c-type biogenesis protein CcmH/NrfG